MYNSSIEIRVHTIVICNCHDTDAKTLERKQQRNWLGLGMAHLCITKANVINFMYAIKCTNYDMETILSTETVKMGPYRHLEKHLSITPQGYEHLYLFYGI